MAAIANSGASPNLGRTQSRVDAIRDLVARNNENLAKLKSRLKKEKEDSGLNAVQRRRAFFMSAAEEREVVERMYKKGSIPLLLMNFLQNNKLQLLMTDDEGRSCS